MKKSLNTSIIIALTILFSAQFLCANNSNNTTEIPQNGIKSLVIELNSIKTKQSATRLRRAYKSIVRKAEALIISQPTAVNRFDVFAIKMNAQKRLLITDKSEQTRAKLIKTCHQILKAPIQYANIKVDADFFIMNVNMSQKDAHVKERIVVLKKLVSRYLDTSAELKCLAIAMQVSEKLHDFENRSAYFKLVQQRHADVLKGIQFIRKNNGQQKMDIIFSGTFERNDGVNISFPYDRFGHAIISIFWSKEDQDYKNFLSRLKEQQDSQPNSFEIFSFNLDELDDAGASIINKVGLKCSVMKVPGGKNNATYRTCVLNSPKAFFINEYGWTIIAPNSILGASHGHSQKSKAAPPLTYPKQIPHNIRFQMQLQSLFNGDFFVQEDKLVMTENTHLLATVLSKLQSCIPEAPFRYRLTPEMAFNNYSKIDKLCTTATKKHSKHAELWRVKNYQIIALMGLWNCTGEPIHLVNAVAVARTILSKKLPHVANMIAKYCLAKHALRDNTFTKKSVITKYVKELGGDNASDMVIAAASVLALNANHVHLHEYYRNLLLNSKSEKPYSVLSFLRNRHHRYNLFQGSYIKLDRMVKNRVRRWVVNNDITVPTKPFPTIKFKKIGGGVLNFPNRKNENLSVVLFIEPPSSGNLYLPPLICKLGQTVNIEKKERWRPTKRSGIIYSVAELANSHINRGVDVILAFLSDDAKYIQALHKKYNFPGEIVLIPTGLKHSIVKSLDIVLADKCPNAFLVKRDGSIIWHSDGFPYRYGLYTWERVYQYCMALSNFIYRCDLDEGYRALKNKNYEKAKKIFSGPYLSKVNLANLDRPGQSNGRTEKHKWTCTKYYGKALAYIGLEKWEDALIYIDKAKLHHMVYFRHDENKPCSTEIGLHKAHAFVFEQFGRSSEATKMRNKAALKPTVYSSNYYEYSGYNLTYQIFTEKFSKLEIE